MREKSRKTKNRIESFRFRCPCWRGRLRMVCSDFSMYISKSKAGEQYLDSLNGSNTVDKEGNYEKNKFLVCVKE